MATTGFGQGLLAGLQGAAGYNRGVQQSQSNALLQEKQLREFEKQDNAAFVGQLSNMGLLDLKASNKEGILNTDVDTLFANNKEVALRLANSIPALNQAELENGQKVGTKVVDYIRNDDGSTSFILEREDNGKRVPLTQGRTELGDDVVAKFSSEDLQRVVNTQMVDALEKGGFGSQFGFMQTTAALHPHQLQAEIQRKAAEDAANSSQPGAQEMASQMSFLVTQTDDVETLEKYASDLGLDVDAIRAKAAADAQANADAAGNTTSPDGTTPDATTPDATTTQTTGPNDLSWLDDASGKDRRLATKLDKERERLRNSISNKLSPKVREEREARLEEIERELGVLQESTAANPIGRLSIDEQRDLTRARANKKNAERELQEFRDQGFREDSAQIKLREERLAKANSSIEQLEGKMRPETKSAPQSKPVLPPLSADQLRTSIMEVTNNPEFVTRTRQVLQNAGVTSLSQLRDAVEQNRVPPKEANDAIIAAAVFAANQPGAKQDAAEMVQRFTNLVQRSSQTYDLEDAIDDDRLERTLEANIDAAQTTKAKLSLNRRKFFRELQKDGDIQQPVLDDFENIFEAFDKAQEEGDTVDESRDIQAAFRVLGSRLKGTPGSPNYESAKKLWPNATAEYIRQAAIEEGSPTIPDWFKDFLRGDSPLSIGDLSRNLVRRADGVIGIMDPDGSGQVYESPITIGRLRQLMSVDESTFMSLREERF